MEDLPKPFTLKNAGQADLPLPEKEIPAHIEGGMPVWKSKFLWGFVAISFLIGGFAIGKHTASQPPVPIPTVSKTPTTAPTNSTDKTANWKTYTNSKYGFTIKYPPTDKILNSKGQFVDGVCGNAIDEKLAFDPYTYILSFEEYFSVMVIPWKGTISDFIKKENVDPATIRQVVGSNGDEAITSATGDEIQSKGDVDSVGAFSIFRKNGNLFLLRPTYPERGCSDPSGTEIQEIVSTFKFTK